MNLFSKSTLVGLLFGLFLAGYAVFAFTPPAQTPPGGNVPTPLNVGPSDQTKTGGLLNVFGLWVNQSLGVSGGASFGGNLNLQGNRITNVGTPTATGDVATKGYADSTSSGLQKRVWHSCPEGTWIRAILQDGSVTCYPTPSSNPPKTCDNSNSPYVRATSLDSACSTYCSPNTGTRTCTNSFPCNGANCVSNPNTATTYSFPTCAGSNYANVPDGTPLCALSPSYTTTDDDGTTSTVSAKTTTCTCSQ